MVDVANRQELSHQYPTRGYVTSLKVAKEFIIVGDLYNGLSFLRWVVRVRWACVSRRAMTSDCSARTRSLRMCCTRAL